MNQVKAIRYMLIISTALILLAAVLMVGEIGEYSSIPGEGIMSGAGEVLLFSVFTFGVLFFLAIILFFMFSGVATIDSRDKFPTSRKVVLQDIVIIVIIFAIIAGLLVLWFQHGQGDMEKTLEKLMEDPGEGQPFEDPPDSETPGWFFSYMNVLMTIVLVILAVAIIIKIRQKILIRRINKQLDTEEIGSRSEEEIVKPIKQQRKWSFEDIYKIISREKPRPAIIQAYYGMMLLLRDFGLSIPEKYTPEEKLMTIEKDLQLSRQNPVREITQLYLRARYSHHDIFDQQKSQALEWLKEIRNMIENMKDEEETHEPDDK